MRSKSFQGNYRDIPILECGEPLVSLHGLSSKITLYPYYHHHNIPFAIPSCYLREGAAERLKDAAAYLPDDLHFVVLDAWRPYEVQRSLYEMIRDDLCKKYEEEKAIRELAKYVALPSENIDRPSPHMTGGSVDLTLGNKKGWLDMGTKFDDFTKKASAEYYENLDILTPQEEEIRQNRRLLRTVMEQAGFTGYEEEWWHFDYGNQRWAMHTQHTPIYKGIRQTPTTS